MAPTFLEFQWPHGPFISQAAQLDGTGQALWVFDSRSRARAIRR